MLGNARSRTKYTAFGNVYIVIDPNFNKHLKIPLKVGEKDIERIKTICNLYFGIGSDGIIFGPILNQNEIKKNLKKTSILDDLNNSLDEYFFCRIFNPDGSEAEKSGNGTRIFAQYLIDKKYVKKSTFNLLTIGGEIVINLIDKKKKIIKSDIGKANFNKEKIGVNLENGKNNVLQEDFVFKIKDIPDKRLEDLKQNQFINSIEDFKFKINCVSIGNPHCVIILDDISEEMCKKFGAFIENNIIFKNKINVQFAKILNKNTIQIFIWERGAGYTLSSGTSTAAVASVCYKLNLCERNVKIITQGGDVCVNIIDSENLKENFSISIEGVTKLIEEGRGFLD